MSGGSGTQFDLWGELVKRDEALAKLEERRGDLIDQAFDIARAIAENSGRVTSTDVLLVMRNDPELADLIKGKDPRFMGPVFRRTGWRRVGWTSKGSHGRQVAVWEWSGR